MKKLKKKRFKYYACWKKAMKAFNRRSCYDADPSNFAEILRFRIGRPRFGGVCALCQGTVSLSDHYGFHIEPSGDFFEIEYPDLLPIDKIEEYRKSKERDLGKRPSTKRLTAVCNSCLDIISKGGVAPEFSKKDDQKTRMMVKLTNRRK